MLYMPQILFMMLSTVYNTPVYKRAAMGTNIHEIFITTINMYKGFIHYTVLPTKDFTTATTFNCSLSKKLRHISVSEHEYVVYA